MTTKHLHRTRKMKLQILLIPFLLFFGSQSQAQSFNSSIEEINYRVTTNGYLEVELCGRNFDGNPNQRVCRKLAQSPHGELVAITNIFAMQSATKDTERLSSDLRDTNAKMEAMSMSLASLSEEIREMNNQNLLAIRDQLLARVSALPIDMIEDPEVIRQIRAIVAEEVKAAFEARE